MARIPIAQRRVSSTPTPTGGGGNLQFHDENTGKAAAGMLKNVAGLATAIGKAEDDAEDTLWLKHQAELQAEADKQYVNAKNERGFNASGGAVRATENLLSSDAYKNAVAAADTLGNPKRRAKALRDIFVANSRLRNNVGGHENNEVFAARANAQKVVIQSKGKALAATTDSNEKARIGLDYAREVLNLSKLYGEKKETGLAKAAQAVAEDRKKTAIALANEGDAIAAEKLWLDTKKSLKAAKRDPSSAESAGAEGLPGKFSDMVEEAMGTEGLVAIRHEVGVQELIQDVDGMDEEKALQSIYKSKKHTPKQRTEAARFIRQKRNDLKIAEDDQAEATMQSIALAFSDAARKGEKPPVNMLTNPALMSQLSSAQQASVREHTRKILSGTPEMEKNYFRFRRRYGGNPAALRAYFAASPERSLEVLGEVGWENYKKLKTLAEQKQPKPDADKLKSITYSDGQLTTVARNLYREFIHRDAAVDDPAYISFLNDVRQWQSVYAESNNGKRPRRSETRQYIRERLGRIDKRGFFTRTTDKLKSLVTGKDYGPKTIPPKPGEIVPPGTQSPPSVSPRKPLSVDEGVRLLHRNGVPFPSRVIKNNPELLQRLANAAGNPARIKNIVEGLGRGR